MLGEYREDISYLKQNDAHFAKIFDKQNLLDDQVEAIEKRKTSA